MYAIPTITLDFDDGYRVINSDPSDHIIHAGGHHVLRDLWVAHPGGELVCEDFDGNGSDWTTFACFTNPRGATKYEPTGVGYAESWTATDPNDGTKRVFGGSDASRIERDGRPVAWLISEEVSRYGQLVRHFYQEDNLERLRVAVLFGGDKVVQFIYDNRDTNVRPTCKLGVKRSNSHLLREIRVLDGCVPVQDESTPGNPTVSFAACENATILERVFLEYKNPADRYTGRYVLSSWRHASGDGSVSYRPVTFESRGDSEPARGDGSDSGNIAKEVSRSSTEFGFEIPNGLTLGTGSGYAPYYVQADWNRDGFTDVIQTKGNDDYAWPTWDTTDHRIYVQLRNQTGLDSSVSYKEPLARYAAWVQVQGFGDWIVMEEPYDDWAYALSHGLGPDMIKGSEVADAIGSNPNWAEATIRNFAGFLDV